MGQNNSASQSRTRQSNIQHGQGYPQQSYPQQHLQQGYQQNVQQVRLPNQIQNVYPQQPPNQMQGQAQQPLPIQQGNPQQQRSTQVQQSLINTAQAAILNHEYMYQSNFSTTLDDTRKKLGGEMNDDISIVDKKISADARKLAESILVGLLKHQNGGNGCYGLSPQGSFYEGISLNSHKEFNFMITFEDVGSAITEVRNGSQPGYVDIKIRPTGKAINRIEDFIKILSPPGEGQFWQDIKKVVSSTNFPQGWSLREDSMIKSSFFFHGPSVSILFNVSLPSTPDPIPVIIDLAVGVPIPKSHYPTQIDIQQRIPYDHPLFDIIGDCFKSTELFVVVKNDKLRLSFSDIEKFLIGNMPTVFKSGYLMFRTFRDCHISHVYKYGVLPQRSTSTLLLKTIFLHELFTFPEIDDWEYAKGIEPNPPHTRDFKADRLMGMILRWSKAVKTIKLPNFFISTANVMNPKEDYEDDDDFLDIAALQSFQQSVPALVNHVTQLQDRINALQVSEPYQLPLPGNPYARSTTVVGWMFKEQNYVNGRRFQHANKEFTVIV